MYMTQYEHSSIQRRSVTKRVNIDKRGKENTECEGRINSVSTMHKLLAKSPLKGRECIKEIPVSALHKQEVGVASVCACTWWFIHKVESTTQQHT